MILGGIFFALFFLVIGRSYYRLAKRFQKNKYLNAGLGIACYFVVNFSVSFFVQLLVEIENSMHSWSYYLLYAPVVLGMLSCIFLHKKLEKKWQREQQISESDILDDQLIP